MRAWLMLFAIVLGACTSDRPLSPREQWPPAAAAEWYARQPWLVGANFVPSTAVNQLEMWQADAFDEETIDRELGWAADLGLNTVRVFLHDRLWFQDARGFLERVDRFLGVADRHGIRTMLVLFDGVWDPLPVLGPQPEPVPHVHNSRWVQILCTEYMARPLDSTFAGVLPIFQRERIGAYHWGLVVGKTQTNYHWLSWVAPSPSQADPWFHDVLHADGTPYDDAEAALIGELTGAE